MRVMRLLGLLGVARQPNQELADEQRSPVAFIQRAVQALQDGAATQHISFVGRLETAVDLIQRWRAAAL